MTDTDGYVTVSQLDRLAADVERLKDDVRELQTATKTPPSGRPRHRGRRRKTNVIAFPADRVRS